MEASIRESLWKDVISIFSKLIKVLERTRKGQFSSETAPLPVSIKISTPTGNSQGRYERENRKSEMVNSC